MTIFLDDKMYSLLWSLIIEFDCCRCLGSTVLGMCIKLEVTASICGFKTGLAKLVQGIGSVGGGAGFLFCFDTS